MATLYGAGAYTGSNPIGGGNGYVSAHGYTQAGARYVVATLAELNSAMASATSGQVIWIPNGTTIVVPTVSNPGSRIWLPNPVKPGVVLASNRGQGGAAGGKIKLTATVTGAFATGIWCRSNSVISGLTIEGPTNLGIAGSKSTATLCALKISGAVNVEVENCHLYNFPQGIISIDNIKASGPENLNWNSANRHKIHHCEIHGAQAHGWGYGILQSNANGKGLAAYVHACKLYDNRHSIACDHGEPYSYEVAYCEVGESWYWSENRPGATRYNACQIDAHGMGHTGGYAGRHYEVHHNTFHINGTKANFGVRGYPSDQHRTYNNWTKKTNHTGLYPAGGAYEVPLGKLVDLEESEGGEWGGRNDMPSYKVYVYSNWYGSSAPPGGIDPPPVSEIVLESFTCAPPNPVPVGASYTLTATLRNTGATTGTATVIIGWITGSTRSPLSTQTVTVAAGGTATATYTGHTSADGVYTMYCSVGAVEQTVPLVVGGAEAPAVATSAATNVQTTTATLNGNLVSLGTEPSGTVAFEWGKTPSYGNTTPGQVRSSTGAYSAALSGLEPDTTYHFRAKLVAGTSNYYGADLTFKTASLPVEAPVVRTDPAQNIYLHSARLHLELLSMGSATSVQLYWEYGKTLDYGSETSPRITRTTAPQSCQQELTGLEPATAYHFRAVVVGNNGKTAYGADRTFTTEAVPRIPVCLTLPAEQVTQTQALLRGQVQGISPETPVVAAGFRWGLSADALTAGADWSTYMIQDGPISYLLDDLDPDTTYYYQAYMRLG